MRPSDSTIRVVKKDKICGGFAVCKSETVLREVLSFLIKYSLNVITIYKFPFLWRHQH